MKKIFYIVILIILIITAVYFYINQDAQTPIIKQGPNQTNNVKYTKNILDWTHNLDEDISLYFIGGAVGDFNFDGKKDIYVSGGKGQGPQFFNYDENKKTLVNITETFNFPTWKDESYGAAFEDIDGDGKGELLIARYNGLFSYSYKNVKFEENKIPVELDGKTDIVDITPLDYDNDGDIDLYLSTFVRKSEFVTATFNNPSHAKPNILLENINGKFVDSTNKANAYYKQNTFTASASDLDNDGYDDLIVAPNTGQLFVAWNDKGVFSKPVFLTDYGFWMGLAISDINNDNYQDILSSNSGNTVPAKLLRGDARDDQEISGLYTYLTNLGNRKINSNIDIIKSSNIGFGWGILSSDIDLDGQQDLIVRQNYVKWPPHKLNKLSGVVLDLQDNSFVDKAEIFGLDEKVYGFSILANDFNNDGVEDFLYLNLKSPLSFYLSNVENASYKKIIFEKNPSLSRIITYTYQGKDKKLFYQPKNGVMSQQANELIIPIDDTFNNTITISRVGVDKKYSFTKDVKELTIKE